MKKSTLILIGIIPLVIGFIFNSIIMNMYFDIQLLNIIAIIIWGGISFIVGKKANNLWETVCIVNLISAIFLIFIIVQLTFLDGFLMNNIGFISQMPFIMFTGLTGIFCSILFSNVSTIMVFTVSYILQIIIFITGYKLGNKTKSR